jgi:Fe-S cluster assembly protein SufD
VTVLETPPVDHAPRVSSRRIEDFPVPGGREEEWRFAPMTELLPFMQPDAAAGTLGAAEAGHVTVLPIADVDDRGWLPSDRLAAIARSGVTSAIVVDVPVDTAVDEPIVVELRGAAAVNHGHVVVRIGRHARATVVVVHDTDVDAIGSIVTDLGDGASLTMLSIVDGPAEHVQAWQWHTSVGRDASFVGAVITIGGRVVRILPTIEYAAPGGSAEMLGAFFAESGQYLEHRIFVDHEQPHCRSNVVFKGALAGASAHTVWVGDVLVRSTATGTDTYEMNRNLLLDEGGRADSVPNLELETGDVASAGHASATGRFDDEQLFYLMARGIPERVARQLVVRGFYADVLARIPSATWRSQVLTRIAQRLGMDAELEADLEAQG